MSNANVAHRITEAFQEAHRLKEQARVTKDQLELYAQAADWFHVAGELSDQLATSLTEDKETTLQSQLFAFYYYSEEQECRSTLHYERHEISEAQQCHLQGVSYLSRAIELVDQAIPLVSEQCADHLKRNKRVWQYYLHVNELEYLAIQARDAWDHGNLIRALDLYRSILSKCPQLITEADDPQLDLTYKRIAIGNYFGTQVNAAQAMAQYLLNRANEEVLPPDLGLMFLPELFSAYQWGLTAFRSNPEWDHYRTDSAHVLAIIKEFLILNRDHWKRIFLIFEHEPAFLTIMKDVDMSRYKEVEAERRLGASKAVKLWQFGGFFLLVFCICFGAVFLLLTHSNEWWQLGFSVIGLEMILLFIGALTLRAVGDLSEKGFLMLVRTALRQQVKVFTLAKGLFSKPTSTDTSNDEGADD